MLENDGTTFQWHKNLWQEGLKAQKDIQGT